MNLRPRVSLKIMKPVAAVFDAIVDPAQLSAYFPDEASGPLEAGKTVTWSWKELGASLPVTVSDVETNRRIAFRWPADGTETSVEIAFRSVDGDATIVEATAYGWPEDQRGLEGSYQQCQGWMHMFCCLKAYLEYGINLRKGGVQ